VGGRILDLRIPNLRPLGLRMQINLIMKPLLTAA
jgi:hypothetical protein